MKKIISITLCFAMFLLVGCAGKKDNSEPNSVPNDTASVVSEVVNDNVINPLTGLEISKDKLNSRPVAVMINNISIAQPVQTGVNKADIVYETEVEGGITRLMAVFKDITAVGQLGTIRSARYPYVDLALGHDAAYIHCGQDPTYCAPHLKDIDDISIGPGVCGAKRISNGLASEHTLYADGNGILSGISAKKIRTTTSSIDNWQNFAAADEKITLDGGVCNKLSVPFSQSYNTVFNYDAQKEKYTRSFGTVVRKDYVTGETTDVKNVFVLLTSISNYSDGKHRRVYLDGGEGYYFTNGTFTKISWTKGYSTNSIKFTDLNGNALKINAGNSWVCLADKGTSQPVIE